MYGPDNRLIYAPEGARCASMKGGALPGPAAPNPADSAGIDAARLQRSADLIDDPFGLAAIFHR